MEQFRDERALDFVLNDIIKKPGEFYEKVFRIAADQGKIKTNNPEMVATIYQYTALTIFWEMMLREADGENTTQLPKKLLNLIEFVCK